MELKDKVTGDSLSLLGGDYAVQSISDTGGGNAGEAIEALVALGYTQSEVTPIVAKLDSSLSISDLVRQTLQAFGKRH